MLTSEDYFGRMSRIANEQPSQEIRESASMLLTHVNALLMEPDLGKFEAAREPKVNSGWRTPGYNASIANAAPKSKHMSGEAIDIADPQNKVGYYLMTHRNLLTKHGLYMENAGVTLNWLHLQCVPPRSGNLVFFP